MKVTTERLGGVVRWCSRRALAVAGLGVLLGVVSAVYVAGNFAMTSDTAALLSPKLDWRKREIVFDSAFPSLGDSILVVIDGATPELASQAANRLAASLNGDPKLFPHVQQPDGGPFFDREGLLFLSNDEVKANLEQLEGAESFLGPLAADPSLRGVMATLAAGVQGVQHGQAKLEQLDRPATRLAEALEQSMAGRPVFFSWRALLSADKPGVRELRRLIIVRPKLDLGALEPGAVAAAAIREKAKALGLDPDHGVTVRQTGAVALSDEEFASLTERAALITTLMLGCIVGMLWLATRSWKLVGAILGVTLTGLCATMALGLLIFGQFNLISVAFIPLFVGLGVDFGIQFSVRWRAEQAALHESEAALAATGQAIGGSLTLAAVAISLGFLAFLPTDYVGVSQLGAIAGLGMIVALALNLTVLPAVIALIKPEAGAEHAVDLPFLARAEDWLTGHRGLVLIAGALAGVAGLALTPQLRFDFNPLHMNNPKAESVSTLFDLMHDPDRSPNTVEVLAPDLAAARNEARRLNALPQVERAVTLESFIPDDQPPKLAEIADAQLLLDPVLNPFLVAPAPTDSEVVSALTGTAAALESVTAHDASPAAAPLARLARDLTQLAAAPPAARQRASQALIPGLNALLDQVRAVLQATPVTLQTLPPELREDWVASDGRARISVSPKGDANNNAVLARFTAAVQKVAPDAVGAPIAIQQAGATISGAFLQAGLLSFVAISLLLAWVLRRPKDVAAILVPIVLTGLLTLGTCVVIGQPLNDANIIALPLLFGIGVAFQIYFVMAWRGGEAHLLRSSLARAVFFSALTTATGFGSLAFSSHPGTAGMGKLLMISLCWTLVTALILQPALMGPPRRAPA